MTTSTDLTQPPPSRVRTGELLRKTLHMTPGLLPFGFLLIPHPQVLDAQALAIVTGITVCMTAIYLASHRTVRRPDEDNFLTTALSYPATILLLLFLFPEHAEFTCVVVVVIALGDGSAYLGGKLFGKRTLPWNPDKTWAGLVSFVVVSAPLAALAYWIEANAESLSYWGNGQPLSVPAAMAAICGGTAAICGAVAETIPTQVSDNLRVGVAASLAVIAAHYASAGYFLS